MIDHARHEPNAGARLEDRFAEHGAAIASAPREFGLDARVGAVPGEYCPGAHSGKTRGVTKLVGTAQRVIRDAWLFSTLVILDDDARLQLLLGEVYSHLGLSFDPRSVGSIRAEVPTVDIEPLEEALLNAFNVRSEAAVRLDAATLAMTCELVAQHRL